MPGVNPAADAFSIEFLRLLDARVRALETQQKSAWTDSTGLVRVQVGQLPNGDFGIGLFDPMGHEQELLPAVADFAAGPLSTTSGTLTTITGSPSVDAELGASGDAIVTISAYIASVGGTSLGGNCNLYIDGVQIVGAAVECFTQPGTSCSTTIKLSGLSATQSAGAHTFSLKYASGDGTSAAKFYNVCLVVTPT